MDLLASATVLSVSLSACGFIALEKEDNNIAPNAIGHLETIFIDGTSTDCYGALIDNSSVLSLNHCISGKLVSKMTFYPGGDGKPIGLIPPSQITYSISSLSDFPKDVAIFTTMSPNRDIVPIKIIDKSDESDTLILDYAKDPSPENEAKVFEHCSFTSKSYIPGAYASNDCYSPEGTSGRPFIKWKNGEWFITGIYHGYLKIKNKEDEILTQGVATTPSSWVFNHSN